MTLETQLAPPNSLLLIMDLEHGEIPESMRGRSVAATASCIAVATLAEMDAETKVLLTDEQNLQTSTFDFTRIFSGRIRTPNRAIHVCTVRLEPVLAMTVQSEETAIEVWTNSPVEPSGICVLVK
jgi:hypothetical protein